MEGSSARAMRAAGPNPSGYLAGVVDHMLDDGTQWDLGTFGAIAEFMRDVGEPVHVERGDAAVSIATGRGALRLEERAEARLIAYETVSRHAGSWRHGVAVCLPQDACAMHRRSVVTELGPDAGAIRPQDRADLLFDVGLDILQTDVCVRTGNAELIAALRASEGRSFFDAGSPALAAVLRAGPHRVFMARLGRVEVFQPIPPPTGKSPDGPHTHILPKLLRSRRTHAATTPIPDGLVPCAHFYPSHPLMDIQGLPRPFDRHRFDAFAAIYRRFASTHHVVLQDEVAAAVRNGMDPIHFAAPSDKFARACLRVALRKLKAVGQRSDVLDSWLARYDRVSAEDGEGELIHTC